MNRKYNYSEYITGCFERMPTRKKNSDIVEYAEKTIVPAGKYRGLKYKHNRAPFLREILELLSPSSPYRHVRFMAPAQIGKTITAELTVMYYIAEVPSEIMYVSSNETAAVKWLERRIVPRAAAAGIEFKAEVENATSRKTGNTTYSKMFPGGNIDIASALSPAQLASETKRVVLADEVDRWRVALGEEGSVWHQIEARTQAWGSQSILFAFSTPTTQDASLINVLYEEGDQRLYYVPCPMCGKMQLLDFFEGRGHGLRWVKKNGVIVRSSLEYICEDCQKPIKESSKNRMLNGGEWRPHAIAKHDFIASFNINGLYSHMLDWYDMAASFEDSQNSPLAKQAHENLKMGRVFKEKGTRPKAAKIIENRGHYKAGSVPDGVLYLTVGIDVQEGSDSNPDNPPRLEMEILGIGAGYRTWSIDYIVFKGEIKDPYSGAWEKLNEFALNTELTFYRNDGFGFPVSLIFIDSGSGRVSDIVYRFCQRWQNTFPIKGRSEIKKTKNEKGDEVLQGNMQRYRASKLDEDVMIYLINTNYYKNHIYHNLNIPRQDNEPQHPGFCDFPKEYEEKYFNMLTAEERHTDGSFHNTTGRRNEALDTRVYSLCAADVFLDSEVLNYRTWAKQQGARQDELIKITSKTVLENMARQTARKKIEKK